MKSPTIENHDNMKETNIKKEKQIKKMTLNWETAQTTKNDIFRKLEDQHEDDDANWKTTTLETIWT